MENKKVYSIIIGVILISILIFNYTINVNIYKKPPSDMWSKEVKIGKGKIRNNPVIINDGDKIIVGYDNENKLCLVETDKIGKKLRENSYEVDEDFIMDTTLVKSKDGYLFNFRSTEKSIGYIGTLVLDKDLNKIDERKITNVNAMHQLEDNLLLISYNDRLELVNTETSYKTSIDIEKLNMISAVKSKDGYLVTLLQDERNFKAIYIKDNKFSEIRDVITIERRDGLTYTNLACSQDDKYGYILLEQRYKSEFMGTRIIQFDLNGDEVNLKELKVNNSKYVYDNIGIYSEEGARFLATTERIFGTKDIQENIVDYTIKDGEVKSFNYATRLRNLCVYPYVNDEMMAFISFAEDGKYNVNLASMNDEFKKVNNVSRTSEYTTAFIVMLQGVLYAVAYIFVYGLRWILPSLVLVGLISFFDYSISASKRLKLFMVNGIISTIMKTTNIVSVVYTKYDYAVPDIIASKFIGIVICIIISLFSYVLGYEIYKKDLDNVTMIPFSISLLIDTVLTLLIFVPIIV
ncbi:MAG: hypothetical protein KID00_09785 [Clostridium argentinense]|uniref:hypothetical protein n=1 Tax=Clostridium butanoliproducens TaxID=2991837 RepID=UPI001DF3EEB0|nr:hypothetical protein [Clostridium butanoliproducens]MBS5824132.1 hypothetical protein [Clostridium argentinense]MDU1348611.1 hypothetical protein [Clostridium argentinense]